jgi:hypothetical protein
LWTNALSGDREPSGRRVPRMVSPNSHRTRPSGSGTVAAWSPPAHVRSFFASNIAW